MEQWKQFHESKRYNWFVSNYGNVRKVSKTTNYDRIIELSLTGGHKNNRYYAFALNDMPEKYLHRLVAKQFIPNPENKSTVNHIDGNKLNNHIDNLEWATYTENMHHAIKNGLINHITRRFKPKGNSERVIILRDKIFSLKESGMKTKEVSEILNVSTQTVLKYYRHMKTIKNNKN